MTTDLIEISKAEVIEKAKALARRMRSTRYAFNSAEDEFLAAISLLESREAMKTEEEK